MVDFRPTNANLSHWQPRNWPFILGRCLFGAPHGKLECLNNCNRYHKMVVGRYKWISKLHPAKIWRLFSHWFGFWNTLHPFTDFDFIPSTKHQLKPLNHLWTGFYLRRSQQVYRSSWFSTCLGAWGQCKWKGEWLLKEKRVKTKAR